MRHTAAAANAVQGDLQNIAIVIFGIVLLVVAVAFWPITIGLIAGALFGPLCGVIAGVGLLIVWAIFAKKQKPTDLPQVTKEPGRMHEEIEKMEGELKEERRHMEVCATAGSFRWSALQPRTASRDVTSAA
jgi:hypothetical protein